MASAKLSRGKKWRWRLVVMAILASLALSVVRRLFFQERQTVQWLPPLAIENPTYFSAFEEERMPTSSSEEACQTPLVEDTKEDSRSELLVDGSDFAATAHGRTSSHPFCQRFRYEQSASALWSSHREAIMNKTNHANDEDGRHRPWIEKLFDTVSPFLLQRGLRNPPNAADTKRVLNIVETKLANSSAPPLYVAVFGGSVVEGTNCDFIPPAALELVTNRSLLRERKRNMYDTVIKGRSCTWPNRLQALVDYALGEGVVKIYNLGVGGTNSQLAVPIVKYRLYSGAADLVNIGGPDVVINGYAVNDNAYFSSTAATATYTHFNASLARAEDFIRAVWKSRPCHDPPMVWFFDEHFGNYIESLLGEDIQKDAVRLLADYYELGYVSSSFSVRSFFLSDPDETLFSPDWEHPVKKSRIVDGHFGMPGHLHASWTFAYAALQTVLDYCADHAFTDSISTTRLQDGQLSSQLADMQTLLDRTYLPPPLGQDTLSLVNIAKTWRATQQQQYRSEKLLCEDEMNTQGTLCPLAFVATPVGTTRQARAVDDYLKPFVTVNTGWYGRNDIRNGWQNKIGLMPTGIGASIILSLEHVTTLIQMISLQTLKSYGDPWEGSEALFDLTIIRGNPNSTDFRDNFTIPAYHDANMSVSYLYEHDLGNNRAVAGDSLTLNITLVAGSAFKLIALMMCSG
jgi:hypothetical protein